MGAVLPTVTDRISDVVTVELPPAMASPTSTVTVSVGLAVASSVVPDLRKSTVPTISKDSASVPERVISLVPTPSSVITMSASLTLDEVSVLSGSEVVALSRATAVGARLRSHETAGFEARALPAVSLMPEPAATSVST